MTTEASGRWALNIDVEGFSKNYESGEDGKTFAILALSELMRTIHLIGTRCYPGDPNAHYSDRLFAHQFGDGFIICSDFHEHNSERVISIATTIMRHMILCGYATKSAISVGEMADIRGCYPGPIKESENEQVDLGKGLMTIISVMGTALTKAHKLASRRSGALLILDSEILNSDLPTGLKTDVPDGIYCDWISSDLPLANDIAANAGLKSALPTTLHERLETYCVKEPRPPTHWIESTFATVSKIGI